MDFHNYIWVYWNCRAKLIDDYEHKIFTEDSPFEQFMKDMSDEDTRSQSIEDDSNIN